MSGSSSATPRPLRNRNKVLEVNPMSTVHAVFENGVFRPSDPVALPEGCEVEFDPRIVVGADGNGDALSKVYEILSRRFESGEHDVAASHNEDQP